MRIISILFFFTVSSSLYPMLAALTAVRVQRPIVVGTTPVRHAHDSTKKPDFTPTSSQQKLLAEAEQSGALNSFDLRLLETIMHAYTTSQSATICVISERETTKQLIVAEKQQGDQSDVQKGSRIEEGCFLQNGVLRHEMMRRVVTKNGVVVVQEFVVLVKKK